MDRRVRTMERVRVIFDRFFLKLKDESKVMFSGIFAKSERSKVRSFIFIFMFYFFFGNRPNIIFFFFFFVLMRRK